MALPTAVEGGGHEGILISCLSGGAALDLTGASGITGKIISQVDGTVRAIAGTLAVSGDPTEGKVQWTFSAGDLVAGSYLVQLTIAYASGLPSRNYAEAWEVARGY